MMVNGLIVDQLYVDLLMIDSMDVLRVKAIKGRGNSNLNLNLWKETGQDTYFGSNNQPLNLP